MFKLVIIILALALYGAHSLLTSATGGHQEVAAQAAEQPKSESSGGMLTGAVGLAASVVGKTAGMEVTSLPDEGCSDSMMPAEKVEAFVETVPEPQRTALVSLLNASSGIWSAQLYKGDKGVGLCLPTHDTLIVLPAGMSSAVNQAGAAIAPLTDGLTQHNN